MKAIAIIAAVLAVSAIQTAHARDVSHVRQSAKAVKHCWISTDDRGYGRWGKCDSNWVAPQMQPPYHSPNTPGILDHNLADGAGGGGGGGGGGGNNR